MDPRHPLAGRRPPGRRRRPERRQHLRQRAAVGVEHDAGAHARRRARRARPRACASRSHATHTSARKSSPGGRRLGHALVAARAVVADGRGGDEHARARVGGAQARRRGCACRPRGSSRMRSFASALQRWATGSPARWTTPSRPASAAAGAGLAERVPGDRLDARAPPVRGSGSRERTVTSSPRSRSARDQPRADQARRAGHRRPACGDAYPVARDAAARRSPTCSSSAGAKPTSLSRVAPRPSRAPARRPPAATAGATSRLKTDGMM